MVIKSHRITNRPNDPIDGYFWRPLVTSNSISAYPTYWTYVPPMVVWLKKITDKANGNCASYYKSGWWFDACFAANLNGKYYHGSYDGQLIRDGIYWGKWSPLRDEVPKCNLHFALSILNKTQHVFLSEIQPHVISICRYENSTSRFLNYDWFWESRQCKSSRRCKKLKL